MKFGLDAQKDFWNDFSKQVNNPNDGEKKIDFRSLKVMNEHKSVIIKSVEYLVNRSIIDTSVLEDYRVEVQRKFDLIFKLAIKYSITKKRMNYIGWLKY